MTDKIKRTKKSNMAAETTVKAPEVPETSERISIADLPESAYVRSESTSSLIYNTGRYRRVWREPGTRFRINRDELEEIYSSRVGKFLLDNRKLVIENEVLEKYLGIPARHEDYDLYLGEIRDLLLAENPARIEEVLQYCNDNTLENIVSVTLALGEKLSRNTIFLVSDYSGYDLIPIIEDNEGGELTELLLEKKPEVRRPRERRAR